jgi:DNA-binding transcriptional MerR regulator
MIMSKKELAKLSDLVGELIGHFDVNARTFYFYKAEGLLPAPKDGVRYDRTSLYAALTAIKRLQDNFKLSIQEIKILVQHHMAKGTLDTFLHDLDQLERGCPIVWPSSADDGEGWDEKFYNELIRKCYLKAWQEYIKAGWASCPHSIEEIRLRVKWEPITYRRFVKLLDGELAVIRHSKKAYSKLEKANKDYAKTKSKDAE